MARLRYLLLQVRRDGDPMRDQEVRCFARWLGCEPRDIDVADLLVGAPGRTAVDAADALLFGGSGDYSAADDNDWIDRTLATLRHLMDLKKPTFASCWGFQAIARALGGRCIHDRKNVELGTIELVLTSQGRNDPLFGILPERFLAHAGHQDHVVDLPPGAVLLASSDRVQHQAFMLPDAPVYCTQFHPELDRTALVERLERYPQYVRNIAGVPLDDFVRDSCHEAPASNGLLKRFVEHVFG